MFRWIFKQVMAPDNDGGGSGGGGDGDDGNGDTDSGDKGAKDSDGKTILGSGEGKGAGEGEGEGDKGPWSWGENVAGEGTRPPWFNAEKYKTISDQAKAMPELEKKLGAAAELIGAPEGDYELPDLPKDTEGKWDVDDAMFKQFTALAKEMGLSQVAYNKIVQSMGALLAAEEAEAAVKITDALAKIGTNVQARVTAVDKYLIKELGEESWKSLQDAIGTDVKAYLALEKVVAKASGDAQLAMTGGLTGVGHTKEDIETERYKVYAEGHKLAGKVIFEHDKEHREKVREMYKELYPGEDIEIVG